jgi:hypothetical protein
MEVHLCLPFVEVVMSPGSAGVVVASSGEGVGGIGGNLRETGGAGHWTDCPRLISVAKALRHSMSTADGGMWSEASWM